MTSTLHGPDYIPGETFEQHLRRHGCVLHPDEWDVIISHHEIAADRDPETDAGEILDAHAAALAAVDHLRTLVLRVSPALRDRKTTAHAAFVAFDLEQEQLDEDALLIAAADARQQLAELLIWATDVTEHADTGTAA
jgi:hypothetical protein